MPFRKNHSCYYAMPFCAPVVQRAQVDDKGSCLVNVDSLADLPSVDDFHPKVLLEAGIPPQGVSTILFKPSVSDYVSFVDSVEPQSSEPQSSEPQSSEPQSSEPQSSEPQSSQT